MDYKQKSGNLQLFRACKTYSTFWEMFGNFNELHNGSFERTEEDNRLKMKVKTLCPSEKYSAGAYTL